MNFEDVIIEVNYNLYEECRDMSSERTLIKSMVIESFRQLNDVEIALGEYMTLIAGRNGTSKSTILGALAQICSFEKNFTPDNEEDLSSYRTFYGARFASEFKDHFRISNKFDHPSMNYSIKFIIEDAQEEMLINARLKSTKRTVKNREELRFVLRKEESLGNTSRNITHPSIFLGLERLLPISKRDLKIAEEKALSSEEKEFLRNSTRRIFTSHNQYSEISTNTTTIGPSSTVVTSEKYDISSASSGEDNLGQLLMSLVSLRRLKESWENYKGAILLIDEIDASLFPRAQIELYKLLYKEAKNLDLQIIVTTHSPTLISYCIERKDQESKNSKTSNNTKLNYLSPARGKINNHTDYTISNIIADLNIETVKEEQVFKVNCYLEDTEAIRMLMRLLSNEQKKKINIMNGINLGSENYLSLINKKVPEFCKNSIIVLDGDKKKMNNPLNVVTLPGVIPPDQLIYHFLHNLSPEDKYWVNDFGYTKEVFLVDGKVNDIIDKTIYDESKKQYILKPGERGIRVRDLFKSWFNSSLDKYFTKRKLDPFIRFREEMEADDLQQFRDDFNKAYLSVFKNIAYFN